MAPDIFAPEHYAASRRPLSQASPLPGWCYASPEWHAREIETIFRGPGAEWLCIGRVDQVPKPGDFYTIPLLGQPLLVVRDIGSKVHVHSAVCRHRGAIVAAGEGNCRAFICPYHSWTYRLDGGLAAVPGAPSPYDGVENFDKGALGLTPVRSEIWAGFIFVNFDPQAKPLMQWLGGLPDFLARYRIEEMQFTHRDIYEVDCNWKVWLENAFENYHVATIHRDHYDPKNPQRWEFMSADSFDAMYSRRSIVAYSGLPPIDGLNEREASGLHHVWLRPSLQIIISASSMKYRQYLPEGPEKLRLIENWTFPRSTVARSDFGDTVGPSYYEKYSQIIREDLTISPVVQRGMRSGAFRPGRYSLEEYVVHRIANYVLDRVIGPQPAAQRAAAE